MPGKQAKILSLNDVCDLLIFATCTRHPLRNRVIVLLAAKAGLRAGEIANLTWDMVVDPTGDIGSVIELRDHAAKNGSGRLIPVHRDLRQALVAYRGLSTGIGPVIRTRCDNRHCQLFRRCDREVVIDGDCFDDTRNGLSANAVHSRSMVIQYSSRSIILISHAAITLYTHLIPRSPNA